MVCLFVMLFVACALSWAQTITMPSSGIQTYILQPNTTYTVLDPGGTGNYGNRCNGIVKLMTANGAGIQFNGSYNTETNYDRIEIYNGSLSGSNLINSYTGIGSISLTQCHSGILFIKFTSDGSVNRSGFSLTVTSCDSNSNWMQQVTTAVSDTAVVISWVDPNPTTSQWTVRYGTNAASLNHSVVTSTPTVTLTGLQEYKTYFYRIFRNNISDNALCYTCTYFFDTPCRTQRYSCIEHDNLTPCNVEARYGTFENPDVDIGFVNNGSSSGSSRHTVHTNLNEYDSRTGGQLKTVPPGYTSSVRLGNWLTNSQQESLTYEYTVDTLQSDLLIMKYAAVLQNPNHRASEQPHFSFQIMDSNNVEIDPLCYSADFVASLSLGWNSYQGTLWKDWTTVGVDLSQLQGQTIRIKLSTFDCEQGAHYGYAYFVFDCTFKNLHSTNCGNVVENTFTAPDGFAYSWYRANNPGTILSSNRSLHVTQAGEYHCNLQFVGAPAGANCSFELTAVAGERYPTALFTSQVTDSVDCHVNVQLFNNSVISLDSSHQQMTSLPCESVQWLFDDSTSSSDNNPQHLFTPGMHTVTLVAGLSDNACTDTLRQQIYIPNPCQIFDTVAASICEGDSYRFFDTLLTSPGVYERDSSWVHRTLTLAVLPVSSASIDTAVVENSLPFSVAGTAFNDSASAVPIHLTNHFGCDSTIVVTLHVWRNVSTAADSIICQNAAPLLWNGESFDTSDSRSVTFAGAEWHGADSTLTMTVTVLSNSTLTRHDTMVQNNLPVSVGGVTFHQSQSDTTWIIPNAAGCDSIITYSLHVWPNVSASADSTICENSLPLLWNGHTFADADSVTLNLASIGIHARHGEDSTLTMRLHVLRNSHYTQHDTVVQNALPTSLAGCTFHHAVNDTSWVIPNGVGCDSIISYSLHVWNNYHHHFERAVCDDALPLSWCDTLFNAAGDRQLFYYSIHGADSIVDLSLTVHPTFEVFDTAVICHGDTSIYGFTMAGNHDVPLTTLHGCDSLLHLTVVVKPVYHFHFYDTICENQHVMFDNQQVNTPGHQEVDHQTVDGCDSLLRLDLVVLPTSKSYAHALVCNGVPYTWENGVTYYESTYEPTVTYLNSVGCDSVIRLILDLDSGFKAEMKITPGIASYEQPDIRLSDVSASSRRMWFFNETSDSNRVVNYTYPLQQDSIPVLLVAYSPIGCIDSVWGVMRVDRAILWPPNVFTPDETNNNRFFIPSNELQSGEVWIYSRQGILITHFDAISGYWDGTYKGRPCPQDSYVWIMRYSTKTKPRNTLQAKGTVTLLR
jgi:gliding motility-associated-like protein